jgi:hypothetical protein
VGVIHLLYLVVLALLALLARCGRERVVRRRRRQVAALRAAMSDVAASRFSPLSDLFQSNLVLGFNKTCRHLCFGFQQTPIINNTTEPTLYLGRVAGSAYTVNLS